MPRHYFVSAFAYPFACLDCKHRHRTREGALKCARARWEAARKRASGLDALTRGWEPCFGIARVPEDKLDKCVKSKHGKGA